MWEEINRIIKKECPNVIIKCIGCDLKDKRGLIELHESTCKNAQYCLQLIDPFKKQISTYEIENQKLTEKNSLIEKENEILKQEKIEFIQKMKRQKNNWKKNTFLLKKKTKDLKVISIIS